MPSEGSQRLIDDAVRDRVMHGIRAVIKAEET